MKELLAELHRLFDHIGRPIKLMEVCGTHTVAIFRHGIRDVIPKGISLLSGPGCPVCVTSIKDVDTAIAIAKTKGVILGTFGDMMRVPGGLQSLNDARSEGADIRIFYSPLDALTLAMQEQEREVVFFATGFETTSPLIAATIAEAERRDVKNFSIYSTHKTVPPALQALLSSAEVLVDGFILPGHVSAIIGKRPYEFMAKDYKKAGVITGFGAEDIVQGIFMLLLQLSRGEAAIEIQYNRIVKDEGNPKAVMMLNTYFEPADAYWRGIGTIPQSGLVLRKSVSRFDALERFSPHVPYHPEPEACSCGEVLRGMKIPTECPLFGIGCTPENPVGACMVSTEGSCAAYYKYGAFIG